jgi:hypothetical protein
MAELGKTALPVSDGRTPGLIVAADEAGPLPVGIVLDLAAARVAGAPHSELRAQIPLVQPCLLLAVARAPGFLQLWPQQESPATQLKLSTFCFS